MSVVVAYKYAPNPEDATVNADGTIDWSRAKAAVSESDPVAIELGRRVAATQGVELIAISVGGKVAGSAMATKNAMSRGFDRGVIVADDETTTWSSTQVGSVLADLTRKVEGASLVVTADSSVDDSAGMMPALIAGYLGWPAVLDVTDIQPVDGGYELTQLVRGGTRTLTVAGPVVVATTSDATSPAVPSMKDILAAGKKPVEILTAADVTPASAELTVAGTERPNVRERKGKIVSSVDELVAALREDGVL